VALFKVGDVTVHKTYSELKIKIIGVKDLVYTLDYVIPWRSLLGMIRNPGDTWILDKESFETHYKLVKRNIKDPRPEWY
jgi:hypothetical protein